MSDTLKLIEKYNLGLKKLVPPFVDSGGGISIDANEIMIQQGVGSNEYMSFGDIAIDVAGKIHLVYRQGAGHNLGTDGHLRYRYSTDGGATWSSPTTIVVNGGGVYNVTNPSISITSTGRILIFFDKQDLPSSLLTQRTYLIYSDNNGTAWNSNGNDGNEILLINDRPTTFLRSIGHAIEPVNGLLLFPQYSHTGSNEYARVLKSENNGLTWSLLSNITDGTAATLTNGGETCFIIRSDGVIIGNIRSEGTPTNNYITYSLNNGVTWLTKPFLGGNIRGKSIMAVSPKGGILTVARNRDTERTMCGYSTDGGETFAYQYFDNHANYNMYSGIVWDNFNSRFVVVNFYETGVQYQSPTNVVCKFVYETSAPQRGKPEIIRVVAIGDSISRGTSDGVGQAGEFNVGVLQEYTSGAHLVNRPGDVVDGVTGSHYPSLAKKLYTDHNKVIHLVNSGTSGAEFSPNGDNINWSTTGTLYAAMATKTNNYLLTQSVGSAFDFIIITLGVNDARGAVSLVTIETDAVSLINRLTVSFPTAKIIINNVGKALDGYYADPVRLSSVRTIIDGLVSAYSNVFAGVNLNDYPTEAFYDGVHLTQVYNDLLGQQEAVIINGLL